MWARAMLSQCPYKREEGRTESERGDMMARAEVWVILL